MTPRQEHIFMYINCDKLHRLNFFRFHWEGDSMADNGGKQQLVLLLIY